VAAKDGDLSAIRRPIKVANELRLKVRDLVAGSAIYRLQPQVVSITGSDAVNNCFSVASEANPTVRKCAFARFLQFQQLRMGIV